MASLLFGLDNTGTTTGKFVLQRVSDGFYWSTSSVAFVAIGSEAFANFGIAATEQSTTGIYVATNPSESTVCVFQFIKAAGASLALSDMVTGRRSGGSAGPGTLTSADMTAIAAAWGASVIANGKTRDYFLQGGIAGISFSADGLTVTVTAADGSTLFTGPATRLATTIGGLRTVTPT